MELETVEGHEGRFVRGGEERITSAAAVIPGGLRGALVQVRFTHQQARVQRDAAVVIFVRLGGHFGTMGNNDAGLVKDVDITGGARWRGPTLRQQLVTPRLLFLSSFSFIKQVQVESLSIGRDRIPASLMKEGEFGFGVGDKTSWQWPIAPCLLIPGQFGCTR